MYQKALLQTNLNPTQAEILECLYGLKDSKASEIASKIDKSRTIVYKELEELNRLGLVLKKERPNQPTVFQAEHPSALNKIIEKRELELKKDKELLTSYLPDMISHYNLRQSKPGVRYFEGEEGVWKILNDTLESKTEILTIADVEAVELYLKEINQEYVRQRNRKGIKKRLLALDSAYARIHFHNPSEHTDVKLAKLQIDPFSTSLQIYDGKIAYITMTETQLSGTIIEDKNIYSMHKALFDYTWSQN